MIADDADQTHADQLDWDEDKAELLAGAIPPGWSAPLRQSSSHGGGV